MLGGQRKRFSDQFFEIFCPIGIKLPDYVTLEVIEADPVVKGQTAASSYKPAKMDNGLRVMVPPFITTGEKIIVDTNEVTYVRRAE